ncbi:TetR/AcrR family transcriptional regulator [Nocardia sp. NBC_01503]|uniref:TetR/AcrR family transcriptional regulator n=1 Tax=Nocardia sp. NBC_01503 TaxID=2975997 RepID=UPI002E7C32BE|nr:TetR/AcrR family transcriptional regulator [Nocardia sp. NBC_01503]WTL33434.1 TetR/AcrR family transcriptional regulator [Nocardia sp. NBC_01503]
MNPDATPRPGRPRDADKDLAVLVAARHLLGEVGYQGATVVAIAKRAGVNTPAIYRRWPTRQALLEEAIHGPGGHNLPDSTGDLRADLATWVRIFLARADSPAARAGVPGLLADSQTDQARRRLLAIGAPVRKAFAELLDGAVDDGRIPPGVDVDLLFEILSGTTTFHALARGGDPEPFVSGFSEALYVMAAQGKPSQRG